MDSQWRDRDAVSWRDSTVQLRDGLLLVAPGGVYIEAEKTLVVADTHAGYAQELRARGAAVPVGDDRALIERIQSMLTLTGAECLIVAGDIVHGKSATRPTKSDSDAEGRSPLRGFFEAFSKIKLRMVVGNHDRAVQKVIAQYGIEHGVSLSVGTHLVTHGDDVEATLSLRRDAIANGGRVLVGHIHPALVLDNGEGARKTCPAFVSARGLLCLPALSPWARGGDVRGKSVRAQLESLALGDAMGVAAVVGDRVLPATML